MLKISFYSYARYEYIDLPADYFRCLELYPGEWDAPLKGRMTLQSLDDSVEYEAVSYTWGGTSPATLLDCGSGSIGITMNAAALLRRLRDRDVSRRLWVDTVCINQNDTHEKRLQVQQMSTIYSRCSRLVVWLGEEDQSTEHAIDMLDTLDKVVDQAWTAADANWPSLEQLQASGLPGRLDRRWLCLQTLLHNRWFTRTWILQEVALASNPWIHRGSFTFDWKKIVRIILCICRAYVNLFYGLNLKHAYNVSYLCSSRSWWHDPSLISLLQSTSNCSSSLKADRVFSLLGLSAEKVELRHLIKYSSGNKENLDDVMNVYTEVATHFLQKGNFTVLNLASDPSLRDMNNLPTWVPDWSSWCRAESLIGFNFLAEQLYGPERNKDMSVPPKVSEDRKKVLLRGRILDRVQRIGKRIPITENEAGRAVALRVIKQWRHMAGKKSNYSSGETMDEAFARTITMNMPSEILEQHDYAELYRKYMKQFDGCSLASDNGQEGASAEIQEFQSRLFTAARLRTYFVSKTDRIGMGPYCLTPDDYVVDFDESATPFIIRKTRDGCYKLVGEAYIHHPVQPTDAISSREIVLV